MLLLSNVVWNIYILVSPKLRILNEVISSKQKTN